MTVHASKGLEAPIVILPDTTSVPTGTGDGPLIDVPSDVVGEPDLIVWSSKPEHDPPALEAVRAERERRRMAEYRRLLYVALTRAEDRLIVCGVKPAKGCPETSWYALVEAAWAPLAVPGDGPTGPRRVIVEGSAPGEAAPIGAAERPAVPGWARAAPPPPSRPRRITPSSAGDDGEAGTGALDGAAARARGSVLHTLLQHLPDVPPDRRADRARRYIAAAAPDGGDETWVAEVLRVLDDPAFAPLFAPGALAEIPIAGRITLASGETVEVDGRIDRLAVDADAIRIVDYKTGAVPAGPTAAHAAQMALYREIVRAMAPGRPVIAAILWTRAPRLDVLDETVLDAALARFSQP